MKPHAFIAMPFGTKPGADCQPIHFNRVFDELLGPALRDAGFDVVRADEELRAAEELTRARQGADPVESLDAARRAMRHAEDAAALAAIA